MNARIPRPLQDMIDPYPSRLLSRLVAVFAMAIALILTTRVLADAHGDLKSSIPKHKSLLSTIPRELRLTFTEAPELALTRIRLFGPQRQPVKLGHLTIADADKATVVAGITEQLSAGTYTVEWEITGEDGHTVDGAFVFSVTPEAVAAASATAPLAASARSVDTVMRHHDSTSMPLSAGRFDSESTGYVIVRFVLYTALLIVIGAVAFQNLVLRLVERRSQVDSVFVPNAATGAAAVGWTAACLLILACLARLVAQSLAVNGAVAAFDASHLGILLGATRWGRAWVVQLASALAAAVGFYLARQHAIPSRARTGWTIATLAAVVLAFTPAFASHAAASPRLRFVAIIADGLHVIGAAGWLGSLLLVLAAGIPAALELVEEHRGNAVADLINAFSPTALAFAGLVVATGLFAAWLHVGGFTALWEAKYGKLLLAKLVVMSVLTLTGAYNWLRVKPTLGTLESAGRIRRSARAEVLVGILILLITAVLVAAPTPLDKM